MADIRDLLDDLPFEPKARALLPLRRVNAELVLLASIAISLRKLAKDKED